MSSSQAERLWKLQQQQHGGGGQQQRAPPSSPRAVQAAKTLERIAEGRWEQPAPRPPAYLNLSPSRANEQWQGHLARLEKLNGSPL